MRYPIIAAALTAAACSAAHADVRLWSPARFDSVESAGSYDVTVVPGAQASVRAEGPADRLERMEVRVEDGNLRIGSKPGWNIGWSNNGRVHVTVTVPGPIRAAALTGSGTLMIGRVTASEFRGAVSGSGNLHIPDVNLRALSLSVAGSGNVAANGHADRLAVNIRGSGDALLANLRTSDLNADIAGSGDIEAFATRTAAISIAGSGDIRVRGGARCTISKAGSGRAICTA